MGNSAGNVLVSDLTVTCEFLGARAAASDTGTIPELVRTSPKIDGNHLVDVLLKAHVKRMSGLDLSEPVFTTSRSAFGTKETHHLQRRGQGNAPTARKGPRKHTNCYEGTKETHQLQRRDQGNTPTATKGPRKHTNGYQGTKELHQLQLRDQGNTPTATKGPRRHTNCYEGTKETHQL